MQRLLDLLTGRGESGLDRAALELARIEYPGLDIEPFIGILDSYAVELAERLGGLTGGAAYVEAANLFSSSRNWIRGQHRRLLRSAQQLPE